MSNQMDEFDCEILIIGAGPAGLSAAVYCGRAGRDTIVLQGKEKGALERSKEIQNWLGENVIKGPELLNKFRNHAESFDNVRIINGDTIALMLGMGKNMISTRSANITADAVIIATGTGHRKEVIKGESSLVGFGVSYCALCDGPLYKGKTAILYGEDDEVIEDALVLDQMGVLVKIVTQKPKEELPEKIHEIEKRDIEIIDNTEIKEVIPNSDGLVEKIIVSPTESDEVEELGLDVLFIFSHVPSNSIFKKAGVELDENGNVSVDEAQQTNLKGVFAAGDVTGGLFQVVFAAAEGARAGINAAKYIRQIEK